jgi:hypothetical protein
MTAIEILTAIGGTKSLATLDGFARTVWQRWGAKEVTDEQAQALAEAIEARKREVRGIDTVAQRAPHVAALAKGQGRLSHFPPKRKATRSPDRRASIERRRTLAASGPMPPQLASQFTTGELAAVRDSATREAEVSKASRKPVSSAASFSTSNNSVMGQRCPISVLTEARPAGSGNGWNGPLCQRC